MVGNVGSGDGVLVVQYVDELTTEPVKHTVTTCVVMIVVPPFDSVSVFVCTCVVVTVTIVLEPLVVTDGVLCTLDDEETVEPLFVELLPVPLEDGEELVGLGLPELLPVPLDDWIETVLEPLFVELPLNDDEEVTGIPELLPVPLDDKVEPVFVELLTVPLDDGETVAGPALVELLPEELFGTQPGRVRRALMMSLEL